MDIEEPARSTNSAEEELSRRDKEEEGEGLPQPKGMLAVFRFGRACPKCNCVERWNES